MAFADLRGRCAPHLRRPRKIVIATSVSTKVIGVFHTITARSLVKGRNMLVFLDGPYAIDCSGKHCKCQVHWKCRANNGLINALASLLVLSGIYIPNITYKLFIFVL